MNYRNLFLTSIALFIGSINSLFSQVLMPSKDASVNQISLNGTWKFKYLPSSCIQTDSLFYNLDFDIKKWAEIQVPGNWELQGFAEPKYGRELQEGTGLYRTIFTVPIDWASNHVYIAFDGIQYGYTLWVNGQNVGSFTSSYNRQTFDITKFISKDKQNTLAIRVSTRPKGWEFDTNDDWSLSGIFRDVTLFSLPQVHIKDLIVKTSVRENSATLSVHSVVEKVQSARLSKKFSLSAQLIDASGKLIKEFSLSAGSSKSNADTMGFAQQIKIENPKFWTAETPYLYTFRLSLKDGQKELQQYNEHIGIREISRDNAVLKLNGKPIKLKGINRHDFSPLTGRAVTEKDIREELKLMREANINFIRTSHYPPHPRLLELCDSLGFYVMVEVPFGYGDANLKDKSYLPVLQTRAKATVWRDKNHPSVIVWSIGNENPVTKISMRTAMYVKELDSTRPVTFPQKRPDFEGMVKNYPDSMDIYSPHYPTVSRAQEWKDKFNRPIIFTEYAHSMGLDFDLLDSIYEIIYKNPKMAGGAIWLLSDQGILRKSPTKISKNDFTMCAWKDSLNYYDTFNQAGIDGILYANHIPQVDYWQVRKVYSPVKGLNDTLKYRAGRQNIELKLQNRYDFTNLSAVNCKWQLFADRKVLSSGDLNLSGQPHTTIPVTIPIELPNKPEANYYYLQISFTDKQGYQFYEKVYPILPENRSTLKELLAINGAKPEIKENSIRTGNYQLDWNKTSGKLQLKNNNGKVLFLDGPYARANRKASIAEEYFTRTRKVSEGPYLMKNSEASIEKQNARELIVDYKFTSDTVGRKKMSGEIAYSFSDSGYIHVNYKLKPDNSGHAIESGVSFLIPASLSEFRWIGKGPYEAYPGKDQLSEFGFYHLNSCDLYFSGNRQEVDCAVFSDEKGNGFAIIADKANLSVERSLEGLIISHNSIVSGRFNKFGWPDKTYLFDKEKNVSGSFTIVPLSAPTWPAALVALLGNPDKVAVPFAPFYHSYDQ